VWYEKHHRVSSEGGKVKKLPRWAIAAVTATVLVGLIAAAASAHTSSPIKQSKVIKA